MIFSSVNPILASKPRAARKLARLFLQEPQLELLSKGDLNTTFLASGTSGKVTVRLGNKYMFGQKYLPTFTRAARATELLLEAGLPSPKILLTGEKLVPFAYQVSEYIEGRSGSDAKDEVKLWEQIGRIAKRINSIKTPGYGDQPFQEPVKSWPDYISEHIGGVLAFQRRPAGERPRQWVSFKPDEIDTFEKLMEPLKKLDPQTRLIHSDLMPHNVIVDEMDKIVAVIDWDHAKSFPPEHQIAFCTFWHGFEDKAAAARKRAFLKGYGDKYDSRLIKAFQVYEFLTQLPYHTHQAELQHALRLIAGLDTATSAKLPGAAKVAALKA